MIASLKSGKYRQKYGHFVVEGRKSVMELFHSDFDIQFIFTTPAFMDKGVLPFEPTVIKAEQYNKISQMETPPGIMAVAKIRQYDAMDLDFSQPLSLALDGISDPGNLGTIIRTADWFGISQILLSSDSCDFYNMKCLSATMGSFTRVKPVYCSLPEILKDKNSYGMFMEGKPVAETEIRPPAILVVGNEANGIRPLTESVITQKITIPGSGRAESLNASVAAGIAIYEVWKQML